MYRIQEPFFRRLVAYLGERTDYVFLDTSRPDYENYQSFLFTDPVDRVVCRVGDDLESVLNDLQEKIDGGYWLAGWIAYEFGSLLEAGLPEMVSGDGQPGEVLADFGVFLEPQLFDHRFGTGSLLENEEISHRDEAETGHFSLSNLQPNMTRNEFIQALKRVREYIAAGDTYQVNYTLKLLFEFAGDPLALYSVLRRNQSVPYGAVIRHGEDFVLSCSPELFFRKSSRDIVVRPMKGTAARGRNNSEDYANCRRLHLDPKNRSENVMIVDLLRNDLARLIARHKHPVVDTVSMFDVAAYESLLQMTSTVRGSSSPEEIAAISLRELFRALFPCGSITGAPKIRTMEIIDELEKDTRGVYTGAIGYFAPDGRALFNVPIRTVKIRDGKGEMGIGAGITHDSRPEDEWEESLLKGHFLTRPKPVFELFETLLWRRQGGYYLLEPHLERLRASSEYFMFSYHEEEVRSLLAARAEDFQWDCCRVRLTLHKDGRAALSAVPGTVPMLLSLPPVEDMVEGGRFMRSGSEEFPRISFSDAVIDAEGPWFFHKTSQRKIYDDHMVKAKENGLFDYIFSNRDGQVTEGSFTNIFIFDGTVYRTPPVSCGLLPGVMRGRLLAEGQGEVKESVLTRQDVEKAVAIFLCNSVRGVVPVSFSTSQYGQKT